MSKKTCRVFLNGPDGDAVLELPTSSVAMSLFNDVDIPDDGTAKTIRFPDCWANGDGVEIVVRRIPAATKENA
jgi:hypothetical protein